MVQALPAGLLTKALHSGGDRRAGRAQRRDGWTALRIRTFLDVLARTGSVAPAARAAGMSRQSAYALRSSAKGQAFDDAWRRALLCATPCIPDEIMDRAINGCVDPIYRNGKLWGERHRFDNALSMRVLKDLDRQAESQSPAARLLQALAADFEAFIDVVCADDDEQLDTFLRAHDPARRRDDVKASNLSTLPNETRKSPDVSTLPAAPKSAGPVATSRSPHPPPLASAPPCRHHPMNSTLLSMPLSTKPCPNAISSTRSPRSPPARCRMSATG